MGIPTDADNELLAYGARIISACFVARISVESLLDDSSDDAWDQMRMAALEHGSACRNLLRETVRTVGAFDLAQGNTRFASTVRATFELTHHSFVDTRWNACFADAARILAAGRSANRGVFGDADKLSDLDCEALLSSEHWHELPGWPLEVGRRGARPSEADD